MAVLQDKDENGCCPQILNFLLSNIPNCASIDILITNENIISEEHKTNHFKEFCMYGELSALKVEKVVKNKTTTYKGLTVT